jgi:1,2-diacylglycerol 3-alpha-glucosyltransferase
MRILISSTTYPPHTNGQAVFTGKLARSMAEMGHDVMVLTPSGVIQFNRDHQDYIRFPIHSLRLNFLHSGFSIAIGYASIANKALDAFQPDIIHLQDSAPINRYLLKAAHKRSIPVMVTHHIGPAIGAPYFTWFTNLLGGRMEGVVWGWITSFLNGADVLTAPSHSAAQMLKRHHVRPAVYPISCGVSTNQFHPLDTYNKERMRSSWNLPIDQTIFLYVGRLDWEKRPEVLLSAMSKLSAEHALLVLAGTGGAQTSLVRQAAQLGLSPRVRFLGDVPHDRVPELYAACDVFIMPGDSESLSIATLEAMASGMPVLAANSMALPELVQPDVNGLLFQPGSSQDAATQMQWFMDHPDQWERMGSASMEAARRHNIPAVMKRFESVYNNTISRTKRQLENTTTSLWLPQRLLPHLKALTLLVFLLLASMTIYSETMAAPLINLDYMPELSITGTRRILVISPHPDDLVLASGGILHAAVKGGVSVQAVIVSNADNSDFIASILEEQILERPESAPFDYEENVRTALEQFGTQQIIFLDLPLDKIQLSAQTSHIGVQQDQLIHLFLEMFSSYSPDIIIIPHPEDNDADHQIVSRAARIAAAHAYGRTREETPLLVGYLVNYETYPDMIDFIDLSPLLPPARLADPSYRWYSFALSQEDIQTKREAIQKFPFEANHAGWVLASYARPNELFTPLTIMDMPHSLPAYKQENSAAGLLEGLPTFSSQWFKEN